MYIVFVVFREQTNMSTITLYHYTNREGALCTQMSGYMKKSQAINCDTFDYGVCFTSIPPVTSKLLIYYNNWDGQNKSIATKQVKQGKLDHYIAIRFPVDNPNLRKANTSTFRDVYVYLGDVVLSDFRYSIDRFENCFSSEEFVQAFGELGWKVVTVS